MGRNLRSELEVAISARVDRVAATGSLGPVLDPIALMQAKWLADLLEGGDLPARHLLGWLRWYRFEALHDSADRAAALAMFTPCFIAGADPLPQGLLPLLADRAEEPAVQLLRFAVDSEDRERTLFAAGLWQRLADATPAGDPSRPERLCNLASALRARAEQTRDLADVYAAIAAGQAAADSAPDRGRLRAYCFSQLGNALRTRFETTGKLADADDSVMALRTAVDAIGDGEPEREQLLADLADSLWLRYQRTKALADLDAVVDAKQSAAAAASGSRRIYHLDNLGRALYSRFELTSAMQDLNAAIHAFQDAAAAAPAGDPGRAGILARLGAVLGELYARTRDGADLDAVIEAFRAAADAAPAGDPSRADRLASLGTALASRFDRGKSLADLEAAIELFQEAADVVTPDGSSRETIIAKLAEARRKLAQRRDVLADDEKRAAEGPFPLIAQTMRGLTGSLADLDAAISRFQEEVDAAADGDPGRPAFLASLGYALHIRYRRAGNPGDLDAAINALRDWFTAAPPASPYHASQHSALAGALYDRYQRTADLADLDAAITGFDAAARDTAGPESIGIPLAEFRTVCLSGLALGLRARHDYTGAPDDLEAAVEAARTAADLAPDHLRASCLSELAQILVTRFDQTGNRADLDAAAQASQSAVDATPGGDRSLGRYLSNRGLVKWKQFQRTGNLDDLDDAIRDQRAALDAEAAEPGKAVCQSRLAAALLERFARTREPADLNAAIEASQAAVDRTPPDASSRGSGLVILGQALMARFEYAGDSDDYNAAVELHMAAVDATSDSQRDKMYCTSSLAAVLLAGRRTKNPAVLDTVITALQAAAEASPASSRDHAGHLHNLSHALQDRWELTGDQDDLDRAVVAMRAAVTDTDRGDPAQAIYLNNLGHTLMLRFASTEDPADIDAAIETLRESVRATLDDDPGQAYRLIILGDALSTRFKRTAAASDLAEAVFAFTSAAGQVTATPTQRIQAGARAASLLESSAPDRAASLLEAALALLPELAPRQLGRSDQERMLGGFSGLAGDAAAAALADTRTHPDTRVRAVRALRLLESGRAVLYGQALDMRADLSDLRARHPGLAEQFSQLRDRLDHGEDPGSGETGSTVAAQQSLHAVAQRRRLASELATTMDQIRAQAGFASFGKPPAVEELLAEATAGPIVTFNVGTNRSDALLLTATGVSYLELPGLGREVVIDKIASFQAAVRRIGTGDTTPAERADDQREMLDVLRWLWDAAIGPVLDALGLDRAPGPGEPWPRLWWAPGGILSLVPLHAAGHHGDRGQSPRTVLDRVVSSYTPTIRSLRHARARARSQASADATALIVAMAVTPGIAGGAPLPNAAAEAGLLQDLFPRHVLLAEPHLPGAADVPTKAGVLARLRSCAIAHFACHAFTELSDPSKSSLLLHDHDSDPLTVASLAAANLERAQLAYLSACSTTLNADGRLLDEPIQLTSAFQLAGFPRVIGTLWEIDDAVAVKVARTFYAGLLTAEGNLDTSQAAHALHHAARTFRDRYRNTPTLWAAYVHAGA